MSSTDPRAQAAFDAATQHIQATMSVVADRVADHLSALVTSAQKAIERDALMNAQLELHHNSATYAQAVGEAIRKRFTADKARQIDSKIRQTQTDWQSLSLVNDEQIEEQLFADRISQSIAQGCEWELREMATYTGALFGDGKAEHERNPFRPEILGHAVIQGVNLVSTHAETRQLIASELGLALTKTMPKCYAEILKDFRARGVEPVSMSVRSANPGNSHGAAKGGLNTGYDSSLIPESHLGEELSGGSGSSGRGSSGGPRSTTHDTRHTDYSRLSRNNQSPPRAGASVQSDAQLMTLIRRLTFLASRPSALSDSPTTHSGQNLMSGDRATSHLLMEGSSAAQAMTGGTALVNLIHTHREELQKASPGTLDHMVIDVVGSLFEQILSDPRVPPQMARQIGRLQLPVLRVALSDTTFFSSRKHPVRRFVNRIASLACAFDDFESGAGKQFLEHVRNLVQEIVQGDFDQIDIYAAKLNNLENFISQQTKESVENTSAANTVVDIKESNLRVQQRYMQQLRAALVPLSLQPYLRDFLSQVWSQALATATQKEGTESSRVKRLKQVGCNLVMSVQPKGSPVMRKKFLMQLPPLMKGLNEGFEFIGWPEAAQKLFFSELLPAHAESLKRPPLSELEYNLLAKQLEAIFNMSMPEPSGLLHQAPLAQEHHGNDMPIEASFSAEEAAQIGLIQESAVDWSGEIDIDLSAALTGTPGDTAPGAIASALDTAEATEPDQLHVQREVEPHTQTRPMASELACDITLNALRSGADTPLDIVLSPSEPITPSKGVELINHVELGFAYQMNLNNEWQKVRLNYMSPGRAFFVFTRGKRHAETVSLTSRMLSRMCETGRFRAFESTYLIERASARARKQLAQLAKPAASPAAS
jgi:hypothetical protein